MIIWWSVLYTILKWLNISNISTDTHTFLNGLCFTCVPLSCYILFGVCVKYRPVFGYSCLLIYMGFGMRNKKKTNMNDEKNEIPFKISSKMCQRWHRLTYRYRQSTIIDRISIFSLEQLCTYLVHWQWTFRFQRF